MITSQITGPSASMVVVVELVLVVETAVVVVVSVVVLSPQEENTAVSPSKVTMSRFMVCLNFRSQSPDRGRSA